IAALRSEIGEMVRGPHAEGHMRALSADNKCRKTQTFVMRCLPVLVMAAAIGGLGACRSMRVAPPADGHSADTSYGLVEKDADVESEEEEREATGAREAARQRRQMRLDNSGTIPENALIIAKQQADALPMLPLPTGDELDTRDAGIGA